VCGRAVVKYAKISGINCLVNKVASSGGHTGTPGRVMGIKVTCKKAIMVSKLEEGVPSF